MSGHSRQDPQRVPAEQHAHGQGAVRRDYPRSCLEYIPQTRIGDYVLVHVGFAISRVDEDEAQRTYQLLKEMDQLSELEATIAEEEKSGTSS